MKVERFIELASWGFNVPTFMCDVNGHYGRDTYLVLKNFFGGKRRLDVLFSKEDSKSKVFKDVSVQTASNQLTVMEGNGYHSVVMEHIDAEFSGLVSFNVRYGGCLCVLDSNYGVERFPFTISEDLKNLTHRHIVRCLYRVWESLGSNKCVLIDYCWAKDFLGVKGSRLVIYDYREF